ncbi:hypothetical protein HZB96_05145 [Candidatus Gottesmanbacteria bacterium]|nr:hypothetical protein [Candidatus Gottesmanbacteria bacterium]MBI5452035.1 hypothetical protein [Candidatus Gottesmanbacteria bacterium]
MTTTINISLPKTMYQDAKRYVEKKGYMSISELIRDALRNILYPRQTIKIPQKGKKYNQKSL